MCASANTALQKSGDDALPPTASSRKPLGARLLEAGFINEAQLDLALREQKRRGSLLGEMLIELGFVTPEVITDLIANEAKTKVVDVLNSVIDTEILDLIDYESARQHKVLPLAFEDDMLTVALADAFNVIAIDYIEKTTGYTVKAVTATEADIFEALARHYAQGKSISDTIDIIMRGGILPDEGDIAEESPLVRLVEQIIALGIKQKATDIHIEPDDKILRVRQRVDGIMRQEVLVPKTIQPALIARIKLIAGLNITEKRVPQDGRIHFVFGQTEVDLRVSTLPTNHGESVVMRILDTSGVRLELQQLGFSQHDETRFMSMVEKPYGMVLVTGPTGSGKTTTLYAALSEINSEQRSVFTLEDPIEYSINMIRQTQVQPEVGMDFAAGLRALLRQDPDVILIGEIRDTETAQLATRAALTGHLVLSTLHTNTAVGVIPRLLDMEVESYLLPSALSAAIGQRLVRKICTNCKQPLKDPHILIERLGLCEQVDADVELWQGVGCDSCNQTGYSGRQAIYEIMLVNESFHDAIINGGNTSELQELAEKNGMHTMLEDGIEKAISGATTLEEVIRVVR